MAGFDYAKMTATASRLLERFKQGTVTITKPGTTSPAPNPWDPPVTSDPVVHTLDATVKGVSEGFINGTTILATDLEVTAAVFGAELAPGDTMAIDGKTVTVVRDLSVPAAGIRVAHRWIVRG